MMSHSKNIFFAALWSIVMLGLSCTHSNSDNKKALMDRAKELVGKKIEINPTDSIMYKYKPKILILVPDTGDCTTCTMHVYDWYVYKLDLKKNNLECDIIYILNDSAKLNNDIQKLMGYYNLSYNMNLNSFLKKNKLLIGSTFNTYLISKNFRIELVGSPLNNEKLWKLYKEAINKEIRHS